MRDVVHDALALPLTPPRHPIVSPQSIKKVDFAKAITFMENMVARFDVGPGARQVRIAEVQFANSAAVNFRLARGINVAGDCTSQTCVTNSLRDIPPRGAEGNGKTCPSLGMDLVSQEVLCPTWYVTLSARRARGVSSAPAYSGTATYAAVFLCVLFALTYAHTSFAANPPFLSSRSPPTA